MKDLIIKDNSPMILASPRNAGKSNAARFFAEVLTPHTDITIVFCSGASIMQYDYMKDDKTVRLYDELSTEKIDECFKINEKRLKKKQHPIHFLILLDDTITRDNKYEEQVARIFRFGRHYHINCILICHGVQEISTVVKDNCSYFATFKQNTLRQKKYVFENLLSSVCETQKQANAVIDNLEPYQMIFVDFTGGKTRVCLFTAPLMEDSSHNVGTRNETVKIPQQPLHTSQTVSYKNDSSEKSEEKMS